MHTTMQRGDFVKIDYMAQVKDTNKVFDTTIEEVAKKTGIHTKDAVYGPVTIVIGAGHVIRGLEKALLAMEVGEKKEVDIPPEEAFGQRDQSLLTKVHLREFRKHGLAPRRGMRIEVNNRWATVRRVSSGRVLLDFNHPLAGRVLHYTVEILDRVQDTAQKIEALITLQGLRGEVIKDNHAYTITLEGVKKGTEPGVQNRLKREIEKHIPQATITFS